MKLTKAERAKVLAAKKALLAVVNAGIVERLDAYLAERHGENLYEAPYIHAALDDLDYLLEPPAEPPPVDGLKPQR